MKDKYYNYDSLHDLASRVKAVFPSFQENDFVDHIMNMGCIGTEGPYAANHYQFRKISAGRL